MKKSKTIIIPILFIFFFSACSTLKKERKPQPYDIKAWNYYTLENAYYEGVFVKRATEDFSMIESLLEFTNEIE